MRVGVYVDTENITRNGGRGLRYDVLREFACRDGADALRLNSYIAFDKDRAETDDAYRRNAESFHEALRDFGYKVIVKPVKWYINDGRRFGKANSDLDMAVDVLLEARNIDRVLLATGDGDFTKVARALQNMGCRVEVVAFDNVSGDLRREADLFVSGYLIPGLIQSESRAALDWGLEGSRVRGLCYWYDHDKNFGFIRYLRSLSGPLWATDTTRDDSPYSSTFVHGSELQRAGVRPSQLPSRRHILEFTLGPSPTKPGELTAQDIAVAPKAVPGELRGALQVGGVVDGS